MSRPKTPRNPKPLPTIGSACYNRSAVCGYRKHSDMLRVVAKTRMYRFNSEHMDFLVSQFYID